MTSTHNLDEGMTESFEFVLGGVTYQMRYPNTDEIMDIAEEKDPSKQMQKVYSFITPEIEAVLSKVNIKVRHRFNKMIKEEFLETE
jgi:hypothetical protein